MYLLLFIYSIILLCTHTMKLIKMHQGSCSLGKGQGLVMTADICVMGKMGTGRLKDEFRNN